MHVAASAIKFNDVYPDIDTSTVNVMPMQTANANIEHEDSSSSSESSQELIMATMIAQYRIEVMLGGDTSKLDNPMHESEW